MAAIFWHDGRWYEDEQPKLLGPMDHAMWMASLAFDGARGSDGCAPDLDRHSARLIDSNWKMLLEPTMTAAGFPGSVQGVPSSLPDQRSRRVMRAGACGPPRIQ
jgi:branched-subunit amino acid aminotransferase/4-amino-4-deoxychorismate lyase